MNRTCISILVCALILYSCASTTNHPKYQLGNDYYLYRQGIAKYTKVYVKINATKDSVEVTPIDENKPTVEPLKDQLFVKPSFDVDVLLTVFKYRPSTQDFPRQLNTDFNGNIFLGYRFDRFKVHFTKTPAGIAKKITHRGLSLGAFGGIGSTAITPWTTNQGTTDEYNGFILSRGVALMFGINNLTVGAGIGWDYLTDRDKDIWIYQNKAWYGLTLSLNLN